MYYELYVDVLFLVNFMMDYILLLIVRKMLPCKTSHWRICIGAALGSILTCLIVLLPITHTIVRVILFHILVNTCMIQVGLEIKNVRSFLKAIIMLYIGSFLLGGIMEAFRPYIKVGSLFLLIAIVGYYLVMVIWKFISYLQRWNQCHFTVELYLENKKYEMKGMVDTGNSLRDPISGKPVSILDRQTARELFGEAKLKNVRYVPYRSIGKNAGVLPAFQFDRMCVERETKHWVDMPLIAISEELISKEGEYEMILNPNIF